MRMSSIFRPIDRALNAFGHYCENHIFMVPGRVVEFLSLSCMIGWVYALTAQPDLLDYGGYDGFGHDTHQIWLLVFTCTAISQLLAFSFRWQSYWFEIRAAIMIWSAAIWTVITLNFAALDRVSTGTWTYASLGMVCFALGARFAWKSRQS
ncbi:MAG: hypothetical protein AAF141_05990 [Pseudomonadota bacterium]